MRSWYAAGFADNSFTGLSQVLPPLLSYVSLWQSMGVTAGPTAVVIACQIYAPI